MCIPAIGLIGAAVSAAGSIASASAQSSAANYNAQVERINARQRRFEGAREQEQISDKYMKLEGEGIANAAKSGIDPGYGSAALVIFGDNAMNKSLDMNTAYINAESQAVAHENKAKQYDQEAKAAKTAGMFGAASSFLSGLGGAAKGGGGFGSQLMING